MSLSPTKGRATLYHIPFWSSSRPLMAIRELGLGEDDVEVKVISEAQLKNSPEIAEICPQKKLPVFVTEDGFPMVESGAMYVTSQTSQLIASEFGLTLPSGCSAVSLIWPKGTMWITN